MNPKVTSHDSALATTAAMPKATPAQSKRGLFSFLSSGSLVVMTTLLLCIVGVVLISHYVLINQSLRLDEAQSLWQTSHSIEGTLHVVAQDVHVPLYHMLLHFWQLYFGNNIATARMLSLLFFVATIPLVYLLGRQVLSRGWALFAAVMFSFSPFMEWYSNEARMYTLLALFAILSQILFLRIIKGKKVWGGYTVVALIGAYSHYFFSFNLLTQGLFVLAARKRMPSGSLKRIILVGIAVILGLLPWLAYFVSLGAAKNTSPLLARPSTVDFFNVFSQFFFGFQDNHINTILVSSWPLIVLVAFFAVKRGQKLSTEINYIATAAFVPVLIAFGLSFVLSPFFLSRYMISSVAPLLVLTVWLISNYGRRLSKVAAVLVLAVVLSLSIRQYVSADTPVKEDYRGVATTIANQAGPQDVVVLSAPFTVYPFEYYYNGQAQIQTLPMWNREAAGAIPAFSEKKLPEQVAQLNKDHRYIYLVLSQNQGYETTIKQYYLHHFKQVSHKQFSPDLNLYVFQVGYYTVPGLGAPETLIKPQATDNAE